MQCNCLKYNYLIFRTPLNINLSKLREFSIIIQLAKKMNILVRPRSLGTELITREVEYFEIFVTIFFIHILQLVILLGKTASCCRIDNKKHFALKLAKRNILPFSIFHRKIIYICHNLG